MLSHMPGRLLPWSSRPPERGGPGYRVSAALAKRSRIAVQATAAEDDRVVEGLATGQSARSSPEVPADWACGPGCSGWVWQSQLRVLPPPGHSLHDMTDAVRDAGERKTDTVARLEGDADIWVATASAGRAHLVPLSLAWDGAHVILATPANSPTARNAAASGQMRLALGTSRDVTIIEAAAEVVPCAEAPGPIARCYAARTGWDPRHEDVPHVYLVATPRTMQAWKSLAEINGRTIMRDGQWAPA